MRKKKVRTKTFRQILLQQCVLFINNLIINICNLVKVLGEYIFIN